MPPNGGREAADRLECSLPVRASRHAKPAKGGKLPSFRDRGEPENSHLQSGRSRSQANELYKGFGSAVPPLFRPLGLAS